LKFRRRALRGLGILASGGMIKRISKDQFAVKSEKTNDWYTVKWKEEKWICTCPDYAKRKKPCKHIYAVNFLLNLPEILIANSDAFARTCPHCGSTKIYSKGYRYNKSGVVKLWYCEKCKKKFKDPILDESAGSKAGLMVIALDLYFKGLSLRQIKDHLWQVYGEDYSPSTVHRWITKLIQKFNEALSNEKIEVGDKWLADETVVKVGGKAKYLWNIMDYETRHHIVSMVSDGRSAEEALKAIKEAIAKAGKPPKELVTDGLKSYSKALEQLNNLPIQHISNAGIAKKENNNRIERLHGTIKEWIGRKRNLRDLESAIELLEAFRLYYNYIRPNQALPKQENPRRKLISILKSKGLEN